MIGKHIIEGLREAIAGGLGAILIEGQLWVCQSDRGRWDLRDFVRESNRIEGIQGITNRGVEVTGWFVGLPRLTVGDVENLVRVYQPDGKLRDRVGMNARVGGDEENSRADYHPPDGCPEIRDCLAEILAAAAAPNVDPLSVHVAYERLHPFTDGNGRSGRAIWLWMVKDAPFGFLQEFYYSVLRSDSLKK